MTERIYANVAINLELRVGSHVIVGNPILMSLITAIAFAPLVVLYGLYHRYVLSLPNTWRSRIQPQNLTSI